MTSTCTRPPEDILLSEGRGSGSEQTSPASSAAKDEKLIVLDGLERQLNHGVLARARQPQPGLRGLAVVGLGGRSGHPENQPSLKIRLPSPVCPRSETTAPEAGDA